MESKYNRDNFERFLKESADQYRMYPSERAWKGIYSALHTRRRWFGIGFVLLMLSAGFVTTMMLTNRPTGSPNRVITDRQPSRPAPVEDAGALSRKLFQPQVVTSSDEEQRLVLPQASLLTDVLTRPVPELGDGRVNLAFPDLTGAPGEPGTVAADLAPAHTARAAEQGLPGTLLPVSQATAATPVIPMFSDQATDENSWNQSGSGIHAGTDRLVFPATSDNRPAPARNLGRTPTAEPGTIESVMNSFPLASHRSRKLSFQFYFSPTISYRKLGENKSYLTRVPVTTAPYNYAAIYYNINNFVTHKPDMGLELGATGRYRLGERVRLLGGLQFNISRYDIKAFTYPTEVATVALNSGAYQVDSVHTLSSFRNFSGYQPNWLHNFYFQLSAPVGIEVHLAGDDKAHLGFAGTIQPTYILGERAYLLSSDYKHYVELPWLTRRWNINTSLEAFVAYSTGKLDWQVGPQIRYQLKSSFVSEYPVKENLFDFGLKLAVSPHK
ncbi:MAG TPA: hypothetical protein VG870_12420 [Chitinophagaceae bacterium]|nr:hypothetical protein [Chitinophagaceae bacterium]